MVEEFEIQGTYLDGKKAKEYSFTGKLIFLGEIEPVPFVGLVNDGRCPAEILNGKLDSHYMQFLKKYRSDDNILNHSFFKGSKFSESSLASHICDDWPGILYYGRIANVEDNEKKVSIEGFYNSLIMSEGYDSHDRDIQRLVRSDDKSLTEQIVEKNMVHTLASFLFLIVTEHCMN